jgi:hypothetical protein
MTDVEQLLQETLADPRHRLEPVPGMYETVRERARQRRQRVVRLASAVTAIVVIAGVATTIGVNSGHRRGDEVGAPSVTPSPQTGQATPVDLGKGSTSAFTLTSSGLFIAQTQPNELLRMPLADKPVIARTATTDAVDGVAADADDNIVWTWSTTESTSSEDAASDSSTGSTSIHAYPNVSGLATPAVAASVPAYTFSAAALDDDLWLATSEGLYLVAPTGLSWSVTKVISGQVFSVAVDAVRHRVLYGLLVSTSAVGANSLGSIAVHELDPTTHAVFGVGTSLPIGKESIAVVGDQIWVGGYGSGSTPRLFHLDGSSLQPLPTPTEVSGADGSLGPGAIVWPGQSVVWVRSGGSEGLACIDPQTGALLEEWNAVQGPVASVAGKAYAVSDGSLDQLSLSGGCAG